MNANGTVSRIQAIVGVAVFLGVLMVYIATKVIPNPFSQTSSSSINAQLTTPHNLQELVEFIRSHPGFEKCAVRFGTDSARGWLPQATIQYVWIWQPDSALTNLPLTMSVFDCDDSSKAKMFLNNITPFSPANGQSIPKDRGQRKWGQFVFACNDTDPHWLDNVIPYDP